MRRTYIWARSDWPQFRWDSERLLNAVGAARLKLGTFLGQMSVLGFGERKQIQLETLTNDAMETSEIEGESLSRIAVRSSVARRLGIAESAIGVQDAKTEGTVEVTLDATARYTEELTKQRLYHWHSLLFPPVGRRKPEILVGRWRDDELGPMQVLSGHSAQLHVHFEAPPAEKAAAEMERFLGWFESEKAYDWLMTSGVAHLYFLTIHPFEDGNGRIARAIADMALSRDEKSGQRYFSMSQQIRRETKTYYDVVEATQAGDLEITDWLEWFLSCYARSIEAAQNSVHAVLRTAKFWSTHTNVVLSERQRNVVIRLMNGFEGVLTAKKYAKLTATSEDTAQRDITDLVAKGILIKNPGARRHMSYDLAPVE